MKSIIGCIWGNILSFSAADISKEEKTKVVNGCDVLSVHELIAELTRIGAKRGDCPYLTVGFLGYPNVGKSSTLNALCGAKKTPVSATPGKTKHFQVSCQAFCVSLYRVLISRLKSFFALRPYSFNQICNSVTAQVW